MSQGLESPEAVAVEDPAVAGPDRRRAVPGPWVGVALAVALLGASAAGRAWQARRVDQMLRDGRISPCKLDDVPLVLGPWVGEEETMDSAIARANGSTDSIFRGYQHRITGQKLSLIILFGPSTEMYVHSPENCYPAAGYQKLSGPVTRPVRSGGASWPFHELVYAKGEGGQAERQEVYCTWRYSEVWTPALTTQKGFERIPGMFKVQVGRGIKDRELDLLDVGNPSQDFLARLMPDLERRIVEGRTRSRPAAAAAAAASGPAGR